MPAPSAGRSDSDLLVAHAAGDHYAFDELYRRHRAQLCRLARRASRDAADAEDAVQEAMLSVHRGAGSFRRDAAVGSWLHRIVVNACRDRMRRNTIRATTVLDEEDAVVVADQAEQVETALVVHRALLQLPPAQRAAIIAVDMYGYSIAEAAALLEVAEGTIKSRRSRARTRLAALLGRPAQQ